MLVEDLNPKLPTWQQSAWTLIGLSKGSAPIFFPNPNYISEALVGKLVEERSYYRSDVARHWKPRAMGSEAIFQGGRWYFTGRTEALRLIVDWLKRAESGEKARVVTGSPGAGKSAVIGYIVTVSDSQELLAPQLIDFLGSMPEGTRPEAGCVTAAVHLKGKTLQSALKELSHWLNTEPNEVLNVLAGSRKKVVLIFDALEESIEPNVIADQLLRPLCGYGHIWMLIGSRRPDLINLGQQIETIDLDDSAFLSDEDVVRYAERLLLAEGEVRQSPYRGRPDVAGVVARAIADKAQDNFLVARIIARSLIEKEFVIDPARETIPSDTKQAFSEYLEGLAKCHNLDYRRLTDALIPLAYAQGLGLPRDVWMRLCNENVDHIIDIASAFIAEYAEDDRSVYRR